LSIRGGVSWFSSRTGKVHEEKTENKARFLVSRLPGPNRGKEESKQSVKNRGLLPILWGAKNLTADSATRKGFGSNLLSKDARHWRQKVH